MKFNPSFIALSVSALLFSGMTSATITGTSSVELTVVSKVVTGTCTAKVLNNAGTESTEIAFGDVYKSDLVKKTRVEPLKIAFTNCSGVTKATVSATKGAGGECSGAGNSYSGGLNTGFEIWSGVVDSGLLMGCNTPPAAQEVTITDGAGDFPMNSRIVIADGKSITDVGTGTANAPVTFVVTYP
ncbi:TPA_asm: fimbrial protein [Salmonella enterica subsp. salamae serovar 60:g,m,t:z6]|uniref:Fimbrial protein n=1 Tax=Salmonella enterica subsp. houtenae serovar 1,40:z4,z32:- TaxID=1967604 RepID=A0A730WFK6_SALHO|nr:fimbrial protein [Salmonella enterica]HAC6700002.1 fimbrial protein [Salmonella bongori serovar 66:z65:-]HAE2267805.1 fimbrial protein [Salmonella enterica subsp. enterica serovar 1,9,12:-:-]HAE4190244.1 fimbrial protein [Salmonella enterica subsp. houtenae serovar 1,40:z4,z32:-]HAE7513794.1 fimbrial protein [Salmonella enterica subsp. salamae serovar 60:g,m,t:z6]